MKRMSSTLALALTLAFATGACVEPADPTDEESAEGTSLTDEALAEEALDKSELASPGEDAVNLLAPGGSCDGEFTCPTTGQEFLFFCGAHNVAAAYTACDRACPVTCVRT